MPAKKPAPKKKRAARPAVRRAAEKPAAKDRGAKRARSSTKPREHLVHHRDGSLWARGEVTGAVMTGYWEWFRKDGSRMRSGSFEKGVPVGEWTTYDARGRIVKVTQLKRKKP